MITKEQLKQALQWSFSEPNESSIDTILRLHEENKSELLSIMGDWIIDLGEIEIEPNELDYDRAFNLYLHDVKPFYWIEKSAERKDELEQVINLIKENKEGFKDNRVVKGSKAGMKLTKAIGQILTEPSLAFELQTTYSKRRPVKTKGRLKMSIHGMDFLTMSENNYDWHSCMALDGEYAAGTLSYMCDKCTVVLYLDGSNGVNRTLPCCPEPWNDKKWRMVAYVDTTRKCVYLGGKQYPYVCEELERLAINALIKTFLPDGRVIDLNKEKSDFVPRIGNNGNHYNDFFYPSSRNDSKIIVTDTSFETNTTLIVGENKIPCFCCGYSFIDVAADWICYECAGFNECQCCGEMFSDDEFDFEFSECIYCVEENNEICPKCDAVVSIDDYDYDNNCCLTCSQEAEME